MPPDPDQLRRTARAGRHPQSRGPAVACRLPVERNGVLLNDPEHPYRGRYCGPEDTSRKVAYHNGTVWSWPFPAYCEALYRLGGEPVRKRALAILMSAAGYFETGVIGQLPEVADGDAPAPSGRLSGTGLERIGVFQSL